MAKLIAELSAVMPAYNEQEVLSMALSEAATALDELCEIWELVVVDDGSTDRTPEILKQLQDKNSRIRVLTLEHHSGYSRALIRGFSKCRYRAIFFTDADAQFDLYDIAKLYAKLGEVDMVAGYRIGRRDRLIRRVVSGAYNLLQGWVLGIDVRDVNCAFKLFRRSFFDRVRLSSNGFLIDAELYARAQRAGLTWAQVAVPHRPRQLGRTTIRASTVLETLRELWGLKRQLRREVEQDVDAGKQDPVEVR